ncbi:MAG: hypothetical protein AB1444_06460 [Spirochaetota bacterium]
MNSICRSILCGVFIVTGVSCSNYTSTNKNLDWEQVKKDARVTVHVDEFVTPYMVPVSSLAWEDGIYITRDGMDLYCIYCPADVMSFNLAGSPQEDALLYLRGPFLSMDMHANQIGYEWWIHGDIYRSHRNSLSEDFTQWQAVAMHDPIFNEGAPQGIINNNGFSYFVYIHNRISDPYDDNIWMQKDVSRNLNSSGMELPDSINSEYAEDNPHVELIDANQLLLLFERAGHPDNVSQRDIWFSVGTDDGTNWSNPVNFYCINTFGSIDYEHIQPHLYYNQSQSCWYLYFVTQHTNGRLAIFRSKKIKNPSNLNDYSDWNNNTNPYWEVPKPVISTGDNPYIIGVGEPTLTQEGNLYFVVIYENPDGSEYNRYDADPWCAIKK